MPKNEDAPPDLLAPLPPMHSPAQLFRYCPRCGHPGAAPPASPSPAFHCAACDFLYYFNPTVAVGVFLVDPLGRVLWIRRAKEPARGQLALPGGFVDLGERAEEALDREVREEVNLVPGSPRFLCSEVNAYPYRDVIYPVVDLFFTAEAQGIEHAAALDGVESLLWLASTELDPPTIAFPSVRQAFARFVAQAGPAASRVA